MSVTTPGFYVTGGTLPFGTPSYAPRQADRDLYEGLLQGEFCYVLTSCRMGKSFLMVRSWRAGCNWSSWAALSPLARGGR